jgi:peptide/nickel transport system ATP-binding protein
LEVRDLSIQFTTEDGTVQALDRISLALRSGEVLGVIGESGSGKTTLAQAIMTLTPSNGHVSGEIRFGGTPIAGPQISGYGLTKIKRRQRRILNQQLLDLRWQQISMVFQGSMNAFNPVYTVGRQIEEAYRLHTNLPATEIRARATEVVQKAGLTPTVLDSYPHELSGGMKQRAVIAMALSLHPKLVIADEPTTGLDVVIQAQLIAEIKKLLKTDIESMIVISHDIGIVSQLSNRVLVIYAGRVMELGMVSDIYLHPVNPYTRALIQSYPSLTESRHFIEGIPGSPPDLIDPPTGCRFSPRCAYVQEICRSQDPPLAEVTPGHWSRCHFSEEIARGKPPPRVPDAASEDAGSTHTLPLAGKDSRPPLLELEGVSKHFDLRGNWAGALFSRTTSHRVVHAVDDVTLAIRPAEIVAIVGESGSGKTTLGKTILRLYGPTAGRLLFHPENGTEGESLYSIGDLREGSQRFRAYRRATQSIFQDPYDSLDPKLTVFDIVEEPLRAHRLVANPAEVRHRIEEALKAVQLSPPRNFLDRYPHELSGGERQRVAAARALVLRPQLLIADEPISMLDVSLRTGFLNLLQGIRREFSMSILYITHDIVSARYLADRIMVMYLGIVVEQGLAEGVIYTPLHPYTKALIQAVPSATPDWTPGKLDIVGTVGNAIDVPAGCRFSRRCPYRQTQCDTRPPPRQGSDDHWYLCHYSQEELRSIRATPTPSAAE